MVGQRTKNERTHFYSYFRYYNWDVCNVYDMWGRQMDDLLKRTVITTQDDLTKADLIDFWTWVCSKAERMGFEVRQKENPTDTKKEYIKKITG